MPHRTQFALGIKKTAPLVIGIVPFGLAYGVLATQAGLTVAETLLMSLVVFAGSAQFMAVVMIQAGVGLPFIVLSTFAINLRHLLMGLSLSPYFAEETSWWRRLLAFGMADEVYVTTIAHHQEMGLERGSRHFMLASALTLYCVWATCSVVGAVAGRSIPDPLAWGLDFAMPATFLTMLVPQAETRRMLAVIIVAALVGTWAYVAIPGKWYIIIAAMAATAVGTALETASERRAEA